MDVTDTVQRLVAAGEKDLQREPRGGGAETEFPGRPPADERRIPDPSTRIDFPQRPMSPNYKIHPGIGIARVGDSPEQFYLAPEKAGVLPIACDPNGNATVAPDGSEQTTSTFKDAQGRTSPAGRPLPGLRLRRRPIRSAALSRSAIHVQGVEGSGKLLDIHWPAYLANKKASWVSTPSANWPANMAIRTIIRCAMPPSPARRDRI